MIMIILTNILTTNNLINQLFSNKTSNRILIITANNRPKVASKSNQSNKTVLCLSLLLKTKREIINIKSLFVKTKRKTKMKG